MSLLDQARIDAKAICEGPFSSTVTITQNITGEIATVSALGNKIGRKISSDGILVNSKNATVVVHEDSLLGEGFPVRNSAQEVAMVGCLVSFADNTGVEKNYIVLENIPDENLGPITLMLGDYSAT